MLDTIFQNMSFSTLVLIITIVLTAWYNAIRIRDSHRIAALGGRAPQVAIYLPFGTSFSPCSHFRVLTYPPQASTSPIAASRPPSATVRGLSGCGVFCAAALGRGVGAAELAVYSV